MRDVIIGFIGFDLVVLFLWYVLTPERTDQLKAQGNQRLVQAVASGLESYYTDTGHWPQDLSLDSQAKESAALVLVGLNFQSQEADPAASGDYGEVGLRGPDPLLYNENHMVHEPIRDANRPQPISDAWDTVFEIRPHEQGSLIVISAGPDKTYDTADDMTAIAHPQPLTIHPNRRDYQREIARQRVNERREIEREYQEQRKKSADAE
jgi:hypothetical protein